MSIIGLERSRTGPTNAYDHAINLVDTTKVNIEEGASDSAANTASGQPLSRQWTKGHLRKELARRKYAKWQEDKEVEISATEVSSEDSLLEATTTNPLRPAKSHVSRTGRLRDKVPFRAKKKDIKSHDEHHTFIDVLYENQRGFFFCGLPLYSSNSLLNFDPAGWQNSTFHDSPVDITNAQVPDPSWQWAWRTWYVDMSNDVDEEGWQYSFSFGSRFAWHGNHPWFHSFVRRRRWLRKRAKASLYHRTARKGNMKEAHMLNADYFTIHATKRDRSRDSSADRTTNYRSSFVGAYNAASDSEDDMGEIEDVAALMAALKRSIVDREKIAAVKVFLKHGGDELLYLAAAMPNIIEDFVHQTSVRQLQHSLLLALDQATKDADDGQDDQETERAKKRRVDNLVKAVHVAGVHINDLDFWSNLRAKIVGSEADPTSETHALDAAEASEPLKDAPHAPKETYEYQTPKEEIKGISEEAQISEEPHIGFNDSKDDNEYETPKRTLDKGKGKAE